jgi:glycosyltransferase involved in cell wall biosynthesis
MPPRETTRRLTVVQILPALESGGVERGTLEVGKYLVEQGHRSIVISAGGRLVEQLEREGSEHVTWDVGRKSLLTLIRYVGKLRRFLGEEQVDILHLRSRVPAWVGWLAWRGMEPQRRPRLITTVHGLYSVSAYSAIMTRGERIIAVSNTVRDYILNNYSVVDPARIVVIPRGIDPQAYPHGYTPPAEWMDIWRAQYPQLAGKKVLTLPGRITRLKGHEDFITLINRLIVSGEQVHGLIVGGAEDKKRAYLSELQKTIARLGLVNDITFTGHRGDLREIMAVSDIVLSLSSKPEAFGRTVLEAISLGSPVVGYAHGGVGELLSSLYPPGCAPMGDIDAVMRQCRSIDSGSLISAQSPLPTLQAMLSATLAVYANI